MKNGKGWMFGLLACMVILSACSKGNDEKEANSTKVTTNAEPSTATPSIAAAKTDLYKMAEPVNTSFILRVNPDLKLPQGDTMDNNLFTRYISEQTNINFKLQWYASNTDYEQKAKLAIASNDLPDAMIVDEKQFRAMAEGGQIEDLTDVYNKYASDEVKKYYDSTKGRALKQATFNKKLMALPNIIPQADAYVLTWVRKDWLDKLGLPEPKTLEDVEKITEAFIKGDPDGNGKADTVGITGNNSTITQWYGHDFRAIFNVFNSHPGIWYKDSSDKVVYGSTTPEAKQALAKAREFYAKGLYDKEFATRKDPNELVVSGQTGLFFQAWWEPFSLGDAIKRDPKADWIAYAITGVNSKYNVSMVATSSSFLVVKKGYKQPEALMKYLNFVTRFFKSPTANDLKIDHVQYVSILPLTLNIDYEDTATKKHDMLVQANEGNLSPDQLTPEMKGHYERWQRVLASSGKPDPADWSAPYAYLYGIGAFPKEEAQNKVYPAYTGTTPTMDKKWSNLQKLEDETFFNIVLGKKPIEAFDQFVSDWKDQGGEQITKEIEAELQK
ncbi:extracellular solute-binding protein [Paenibacillus sp. Soil787]|uniref:extracellular solute-binding protein n=1 Tax=Paenibacillus sp. Soil787 TaxID=1736411 RepID=UPI000702CFC3|nr:extracellular solute-binding protein [Paenibacillus sp. Soil787]KRF09833.1 hypothetical protein ASG93_18500 [Paenibacillus sp. Soil787]